MSGHAPGTTLKPLVKLGRDPADCWSWLGAIHEKSGYAHKQHAGATLLAHRWIWQTLFGPIPDGLIVSHTCGNRTCINPHHLRVTTQAEGCREGITASLTPADVTEIKRAGRGERGRNLRSHLADRYGVTP
jgi:hypothetical protein